MKRHKNIKLKIKHCKCRHTLRLHWLFVVACEIQDLNLAAKTFEQLVKAACKLGCKHVADAAAKKLLLAVRKFTSFSSANYSGVCAIFKRLGYKRQIRRWNKRFDVAKDRLKETISIDGPFNLMDKILGTRSDSLPDIVPTKNGEKYTWQEHLIDRELWDKKIEEAIAAPNRTAACLQLAEEIINVKPIHIAWWSQTLLLEKLLALREWDLVKKVTWCMQGLLAANSIEFLPDSHAPSQRGFQALDHNYYKFPEELEIAEIICNRYNYLGFKNSSLLVDIAGYYLEEKRIKDAMRWLRCNTPDHGRWSFINRMLTGDSHLFTRYSEMEFQEVINSVPLWFIFPEILLNESETLEMAYLGNMMILDQKIEIWIFSEQKHVTPRLHLINRKYPIMTICQLDFNEHEPQKGVFANNTIKNAVWAWLKEPNKKNANLTNLEMAEILWDGINDITSSEDVS